MCNCSENLLCSSLFSPSDQVVPGPSPCPASPGFLLPSEKRENLVPFVGLNNLGNTCYLNSVLQVGQVTCPVIDGGRPPIGFFHPHQLFCGVILINSTANMLLVACSSFFLCLTIPRPLCYDDQQLTSAAFAGALLLPRAQRRHEETA